MKKHIIAIVALFTFGWSFSQQSAPVYEQYFTTDTYLINPSFAGATDDIVLKGAHRRQWQNLPNSPETTVVSAHANVIDRLALGMYFMNDKNGNTSINSFNLAAAYHIPIGDAKERKDGQFSFGTSLTFAGFRFGGNTELPNDPLFEGETNVFMPYINFGGSFHYKGWMAAVSVLDIALSYNSPIVNQIEPSPTYFYGMAGKTFTFSQNFELESVLMYRFNQEDIRQLDANLRAKVYSGLNAFWVGANYRYDMSGNTNESLTLSPALGAELGDFNMAFAYNLGLSDIDLEGNDGFSVTLGYNLDNFFRPNPRTDATP